MKVAYDTFEFDGDLSELAVLVDSCKTVASLLQSKGITLDGGKSYVLESNQTWEDEDAEKPEK